MGWFEVYLRLAEERPGFRRFSRLVFYQGLSFLFPCPEWTFMNYGYSPLGELEGSAEPERYCASLYCHVAGAVRLAGASVLEVGCGRGGGSAFIMARFGPRSVVGLDYSPLNVALCRRFHRMPGLAFVAGDAERLHFPDSSFDAVVNVESSHCYASMDAFLSGVHRVLRPGGRFLFADFRKAEEVAALDAALVSAGFSVVRRLDITDNVARALRDDQARRMELIGRRSPRFLLRLMHEFSGVEESKVLLGFESRRHSYLSWTLEKPAA